MSRPAVPNTGPAKVCEECGGANLRVEFRDQFLRGPGTFDPRSNGVWVVCASCGHERPGAVDAGRVS